MFAGSHDAAERTAVIYSIIATAKLHGVDPFVYVKELLIELPSALSSDLEEFLLPKWKPVTSKLYW